MIPRDFNGKRITIAGLGHFGGNIAAAKYLVAQGAKVLVTDRAPADKLAESLDQLKGLPITYKLGGHDVADFNQVDLVVASPAIPPTNEYLVAARKMGVPVTTEICLFLQWCPAAVVGVTGTKGKSTTASMIGHILDRHSKTQNRRTWLGGNIGKSLLPELPNIRREDLVVLELSSFMLHYTGENVWSPHVAVVTMIAPDHLDWHGDFASYADAKQNILKHQHAGDVAVVNEESAELMAWFGGVTSGDAPVGRALPAGGSAGTERAAIPRALPAGESAGAERDVIPRALPAGGSATSPGTLVPSNPSIAPTASRAFSGGRCPPYKARFIPYGVAGRRPFALQMPGRHNQLNAQGAFAAAAHFGVTWEQAAEALADYRGLPHRLQLAHESGGVRWFNDSIATIPQAAAVALGAFDDGKVIQIVGGSDKGLDMSPMIDALARHAKASLCIGATGPAIAAKLRAAGARGVHDCGDLATAVATAKQLATAGDVVLLSTGCASYDQFANFEDRGEQFARLAQAP